MVLVGSALAGPGSDLSEESVVGVEPATLDFVVVPQVSSRARRGVRVGIAYQAAVDSVGQSPF